MSSNLMGFYEAQYSPPTRLSSHPEKRYSELVLAPFCPVPYIDFLNVNVATLTGHRFLVKNPTMCDLKVSFVVPKDFESRGFKLSMPSCSLPRCTEAFIEVFWKPQSIGKWRDMILVKQEETLKILGRIVINSSSFEPNKKARAKTNQNRNNKNLKNKSLMILSNDYLEMLANKVESTPPRRSTYEIPMNQTIANRNKLPSCDIMTPGLIKQQNETKIYEGVSEFDELEIKTTSTPKKICLNDISYSDKMAAKSVNSDFINRCKIIEQPNIDMSFSFSQKLKNKKRFFKKENIISSSSIEENKFEIFNIENISPITAQNQKSVEQMSGTFYLNHFNNKSFSSTGITGNRTKSKPVKNLELEEEENSKRVVLSGNHSTFTEDNNVLITVDCGSPLEHFDKNDLNLKGIDCINEMTNDKTAKGIQEVGKDIIRNTSFTKCNTKEFETSILNMYQYSMTTMKNPFQKSDLYPLEWLEKQSNELIKWVNSILTPSYEYSETEVEVNVADMWKRALCSDTVMVPSKETVLNKFLKNERYLLSLRKKLTQLYKSEKISSVLFTIYAKVQNGFIAAKDDLDLHCDQGARYRIIELLMYYNPLWLRVSLEAIYGQSIQVLSNNICESLTLFLRNNFLYDKKIAVKNSYSGINHYKMSTFKAEMNKFIVFKFFTVLFFLDQAKTSRVISYDPCLFLKTSPIKTSEDMLNEFIKEFLKCSGHMKRILVDLGFDLKYKQSDIDEYDFAVRSYQDLRNGICLTRMTEIIVKDMSLSQKLRVPTVSRLQKVHNVKVALSTLSNQKFQIDKVTANDIVNGKKYKIMSLLWQILHKFLVPQYESAARTIQSWWRKGSLTRTLQRRINFKRKLRSKAAIRIQSFWRGYVSRQKLKYLEKENNDNRIVTTELLKSICLLQQWYRNSKLMKIERINFTNLKLNVIKIQLWIRNVWNTRKQRNEFLLKRNSVLKIQKWHRTLIMGKRSLGKLRNTSHTVDTINMNHSKISTSHTVDTINTNHLKISLSSNSFNMEVHLTIEKWFTKLKLQETRLLEIHKSSISISPSFQVCSSVSKAGGQSRKGRNHLIFIENWNKKTQLTKPRKHSNIENEKSNSEHVIRKLCHKMKFNKHPNRIQIISLTMNSINENSDTKQLELMSFYHINQNILGNIVRLYRNMKGSQDQQCSLTRYSNENQSKYEVYAKKIQHWFLNVLETRKVRSEFIRKKQAVILIQKWIRVKLKEKQENIMTESVEGSTNSERSNAAIIIQAFWRGYQSRKIYKMSKSEHNSVESNVSSNKLAVRFQESLQHLLHSPHSINVLYFSLNNLDVVTQNSHNLSCILSEMEEIFSIIWATLNATCRSEPYQRIFHYGLNIFLNLSCCEKMRNSVWKSMVANRGYIILLELLRKYYKSNVSLFCKSATLLWFHAQNPINSKKISMESKAQSILPFYYKKMSNMKVIKTKDSLAMPSTSYCKKHKPRQDFVCPLKAMKELSKALCINC